MMKLSTRKIMALSFSAAYITLALVCTWSGKAMPNEFVSIVSLIVGFYFGGETALDVPGGDKNE